MIVFVIVYLDEIGFHCTPSQTLCKGVVHLQHSERNLETKITSVNAYIAAISGCVRKRFDLQKCWKKSLIKLNLDLFQ